jgi:Uma2 family endonuclease
VAMPATDETPLMTAEELSYLEFPDQNVELVRGRLFIMEPANTDHGRVQANLMFVITAFVRANNLGLVFGQDTGFKIGANPDTVRGPDVAFATAERAGTIPPRGFAAFAPELIAEILSPSNRPGVMLPRIGDFLRAGTRLAWVIDPRRGEAHVHRADGSIALIDTDGWLDGEDVLPGFRCSLGEVLR